MSWSCKPTERDHSNDDGDRHGQSRDDVTEIAAEEAVAVFRLDALREIIAEP